MTDFKRPANDFHDAGLTEKLRRYKRNDPDFRRAIEEFAKGETLHGKDDPAEGKIINPPKGPK
ncbi:MAG: hypothetical protein ACAH83_03185 [Alphaproteobacteria bacterium]